MLSTIYSAIYSIVIFATLAFVGALILRLVFNFTEPNPFGAVGRFSYQLKKATDRFVFPAASLLARFRIDTRYAPLVTVLILALLAYFLLQIIGNTFFIIGGLAEGFANGNVKWIIGFVLYALISIYILFIFIRFLSSWFVFSRNTFFGFVRRVTDPVLLPVQRLIPPIGMFDISAMIVLLLLSFLQSIVLQIFVR